MEELFSAGKAYLKINSLVKTPLHEFMAVERSGLWAPGSSNSIRRLSNDEGVIDDRLGKKSTLRTFFVDFLAVVERLPRGTSQ